MFNLSNNIELLAILDFSNLYTNIKIKLHKKLFIIFFCIIFFSELNQETTPSELPITGNPFVDIALDLVFTKGHPVFILNGKKLQLVSPLDRDKDNLSHIVFQVKIFNILYKLLFIS